MSFRRDFDAEAVARAHGERPKGIGVSGGQTVPTPPPAPSERVIVIPKTDLVLADLLAKKCAIKPVGDDWHIRARTQAEADAIVGMLKLKGVHCILKRPNR
jgi:hypothetical protein